MEIMDRLPSGRAGAADAFLKGVIREAMTDQQAPGKADAARQLARHDAPADELVCARKD
jgi:hypothetical protein